MAWLKYYQKEREVYPEYHVQKYNTPKEAHKITKKLLRHFKLSHVKVYYNKNSCGVAGIGYIALPKRNISLAVICHEIGHHVARKKTGQWRHNKKTWNKMKQVYKYAKKYLNNIEIENWIVGNDVY